MSERKTKNLVLCALFASLNAVLSQISIPIGPVPINFTHISTFVAAGLPGGLNRILGPTGGYIIAYTGCAFVAGRIMERFGKSTAAMTVFRQKSQNFHAPVFLNLRHGMPF
ncbi:biotin transporter BioY [Lachnospiraceae bacterium 54-53]